MKYRITKKQIIEAVTTEPLTHGIFFENKRAAKTCPVCAVGAVLRKVDRNNCSFFSSSITGFNVTDNMYASDHLWDAEHSDNFLAILSTHHETFADEHNCSYNMKTGTYKLVDMDLQRLHLLNVIEAFCPPVVEFEVE